MLRLSSALKVQESAKKATCETLISFFSFRTSFKYRCLKFLCVCVCVLKTRLRSLPQVKCCRLSFEVKSFGWLRLFPVKRALTRSWRPSDLSHGRDLSWVPECLLIRSSLPVCPAGIGCLSFCKESSNEQALDWRIVTCPPSNLGCQKLKECVCVLFFAVSALHRFQGHGPWQLSPDSEWISSF